LTPDDALFLQTSPEGEIVTCDARFRDTGEKLLLDSLNNVLS